MIKDLLTLNDTVELMNSMDYRDRFVAEYIQTAIRHEKLRAFVTRIESAEIWCTADKPEHDCPLVLLKEQQGAMGRYLHLLEVRAVMEDIDLADAIAGLTRKRQNAEGKAQNAAEPCRMSEKAKSLPDLTFAEMLDAIKRCAYQNVGEGLLWPVP